MNETLVSEAWYRVADLRPSVAPGTTIARQAARDRVWQVLTDSGTGRQVRLNEPAYAFVGRCDGSRTVDALWNHLLARMGDDAPTQEDIVGLLSRLHAVGLLQFDSAPNLATVFARRDQETRKRRRAFINPLALRMRLVDPTAFIELAYPRLRALFGAPALLFWLLVVALGALVCAVNFAALRAEVAAHLDAPRTALLFWLCYPPLKALHECGHALVLRHFGGTVREAGITLLFFTPAPYVDASAASALPGRWQRAAVAGAGILVELFVAAVAALVWVAIEPGLIRDFALVTLVIAGVSTILINANPLLRFDGYYILTDVLDLPNLALRSSAWWNAQAQRVLIGANRVPETALSAGERKYLVFYAPAALVWRVALLMMLTLWVGEKSWLAGALVGAGAALWLLRRPVATLIGALGAGLPAAARRRARLMLAAGGAFAALALFALPLPNAIVALGVVWPPEDAQVRAETAGFVASLAARHGATVVPGQVLATLRDDALVAEHERLQSRLSGFQARQYVSLLRDPLQATNLAEDIGRTKAELARADQQLDRLEVRGHAGGQLVLPRADDLPGSYAARGAMLGYILTPGPANVRAALPEHDALLVRGRVRAVEVRLVEAPLQNLVATLSRELPAATRLLPSAALGAQAGGAFAVDPTAKDGARSIDPVYLVDVAVSGQLPPRIGSRAWVRFDLGYEPMGNQAIRRLRQLLLKHFNPLGQA